MKGRPESLGRYMRKQGNRGELHCSDPDPSPGEFDELLREIEKEATPERLLELARQLQAALLAQRERKETEPSPTQV